MPIHSKQNRISRALTTRCTAWSGLALCREPQPIVISLLAQYHVGCGGKALWTCDDSLHTVSPAHCFWKITSSDCKSLQLTLLIQLWLVAVSTWSSFGRNRNSTVPFCLNRNQAESIFLGGFSRNTETEFRSVSKASIVSKQLDRLSCILAQRLSSTYPTLYCKEIQLRDLCALWLLLTVIAKDDSKK